jgi:hypothetical protein
MENERSEKGSVGRIIKPGRVVYLFVAVLCSPYLVITTGQSLENGSPYPVPAYVAVAALFLSSVFIVMRTQIVVDSRSLVYKPGLGFSKEIEFEQISESRASGSSAPLYLRVFVHGKRLPALTLRLLPFRKQDIEWLLSVKELKIRQ